MRGVDDLRDLLRRRRLAAASERTMMPPPARAFARFGARSVVAPPTRLHGPEFFEIGDDVEILELGFLAAVHRPGSPRPPRVVIHDRVRINQMVTLACTGRVEIGPDAMIAAGVFIGDSSHEFTDVTRPISEQHMTRPLPVTIGAGSFIGLRSVILPGTKIGEGAFVGAGSVVSGVVDPHTVVSGNPAKVIRRYVEGEGWVRD